MDNPYNDIDWLKALWNDATDCMSEDYPVMPTTLMDTHPRIYERAYSFGFHPTPPPSTKDLHSLNVLKANTDCRTGRVTVYHEPCYILLQRHHLALETMLVLGKLCPQRRPGELY